jgi:hypothetical protein
LFYKFTAARKFVFSYIAVPTWKLFSAGLIFSGLYDSCLIMLFLFDNVIYIFLLLWLCILIVCLCMTTLTVVFPCYFLSCKANVGKTRKDGARPALFLIFVLFYLFFVLFCVLIVLWHSLYFLCLYVYWTTATRWLPNCS